MICTYCGETADTYDHVAPVSSVNGGRRASVRNRKLCVPACRECNSVLGNRGGDTVGDRAAYLVGRYLKRYRKSLAQPDWSEDEMAELGPNMRREVARAMAARESAAVKIETCRMCAMLSPTIAEVWAVVDEREGET